MREPNFTRNIVALCLIFFFSMFWNDAYAHIFNQNEDISVEYEECDGRIRVRILHFFYDCTFCDDDYLKHAKMSYKNSSGSWIQFVSLGSSNSSCSSPSVSGSNGHSVFSTTDGPCEDDSGDKTYTNVYWTSIPQELYDLGSVEIRIEGEFADDATPDTKFDKEESESISKPSDPTGLTATMDECSSINLTWTIPSVPGCIDNVDYEIIRTSDNITQTITNSTQTTYTWTSGLQAGTDYTFTIRTIYNYSSGGDAVSLGQTSTTGSIRDVPIPPSLDDVAEQNCNQKLRINWSWASGDQLDNFIIERSTSSSFSSIQKTYTLPTNPTSYTDEEDITPGQVYYYRIRAKNNCDVYSSNSNILSASVAAEPAAAVLSEAIVGPNYIDLNWSDNSTFETKYKVYRLEGGVAEEIADLGPNSTSFRDDGAELCKEYSYQVRVFSPCFDDGITSNLVDATLSPDLSGTFPDNSFQASKGYFPDKVLLTWQNTNDNLINKIKIERRKLGSGDPFILIESDNTGSGTYPDDGAEAGVVYEYRIYAEGLCVNNTVTSNEKRSIGFRSPFGTVTGKVTYEGGIAVGNVRISAENSQAGQGTSLFLGGSDKLTIHDTTGQVAELDPTNGLLVETWMKPTDLANNFTLFDKSNSYKLTYQASNQSLIFEISNGGLANSVSYDNADLMVGEFVHIGAQLYNDTLQIFLNGELKVSEYVAGASIDVTDSDIVIGSSFKGYLDEIRIWNKGKNAQELWQDHSRYVASGEAELAVYLRVAANAGNYCYDVSKTGDNFNNNHAMMTSDNLWRVGENDSPTESQLSAAGYTDQDGNYTVVVPYKGIGETFILTPRYTIHDFNPSTRALYIGDGSFIHNNVDFIDESSFKVSGTVFYSNTSCPLEGATFVIDGVTPVVLDGELVKSEADGSFEFEVPIGKHFIKIERAGHTFDVGRFPETGRFDFQEDKAGINFKDSTRYKVVGRVVGGQREGSKKPGLGRSKNNIGQANVTFSSQLGGANPCSQQTVMTDATTGEYIAYLPPLKYTLNVEVPSNPNINFGALEILDLSNISVERTVRDTFFESAPDTILEVNNVYDESGMLVEMDTVYDTNVQTISSIDSISFHKQRDFIYRVDPIIVVKASNGIDDFIGDETYSFTSPFTDEEINIDLRANPLRWPVFHNDGDDKHIYRCLIKVFEEYKNYDLDVNNPVLDSVPNVDGKLVVNNELSHLPNFEVECNKFNTHEELRSAVYSFKPSIPSFADFSGSPLAEYSYTRKFELNLIKSDGTAIPWLPVPLDQAPDGIGVFRGYLLGSKSDGEQFVTLGPDVPEYVLRDPPGSNSYSKREIGSTKTEETKWNWNTGVSLSTKDKVLVGAKFQTGIGVSTSNEVENNIQAGFTANISGGNSGTQVIKTTNTQSWATNNSTDDVGSRGDVYIGKSKNIQFGITDNLDIVSDDDCDQIDCLYSFGNGYSLAESHGVSIVPQGYQTHFAYSQNHILTYLIPELKELRNAILQSNDKYTSNLSLDDPNYGKNNDDPDFPNPSTTTPNRAELADFQGPSYNYMATTLQDTLRDSIRILNTQICLWENAIKLNEEEKVKIEDPAYILAQKEKELQELEEEYAGTIAAYELLVEAGVIEGIAALKVIATPIPGAAFAGYAVFATTTATGIANAEVEASYSEYLLQKERIEQKFNELTHKNHSISGGVPISASMTHESASSYTRSFEYAMGAGLYNKAKGSVSNNGFGFEKSIELSFKSGRDWTQDTSFTETVSYTIDEPDQGDYFSVDVYPSILGWGPIFKTRAGGATSCPHQPEEVTLFYEPGEVLNEGTLARDKPTISATQTLLTNIPVDEPAVFNLNIVNESEAGHPRFYHVQLEGTSNQLGAIVKMDGVSASQTLAFEPGQAINKVLTVEKGPGPTYNYDSLLIVVYSPCQYQAGTSDNIDIVDSVYISAHFLPTCTDVALANPADQWVLNNSFNDTMEVIINDYNINFFDLKNLRFEYKPSNEEQWNILETFWYEDPDPMTDEDIILSTSVPFTRYDWAVNELADGFYDLRVVSECLLAEKNSVVYSGIIDRINPHPFGNPSPADGILSPNDEISIRFNEPIDQGSLGYLNFDIRGVLNGTEKSNSTSLYFDGMDDYMEVIGGAPLRNRDFTITFAAKRNSTGEEVVISQGTDEKEAIFIGFNAEDKFVFRLGNEEVISTASFTDNEWRYYAVSYNAEAETAELFVIDQTQNGIVNPSNTSIHGDYKGSGKLVIAKNSVDNLSHFNGNIHEITIWDTPLSANQFSVVRGKFLSGNELGLLYNWRVDEAEGIIAKENVRRRDATIHGATWTVEPSGNAAEFDGITDYLKITTGNVVITDGMDFTLEFWFKSNQSGSATLFSNGTGSGLEADSIRSWNISKDADNRIIVRHQGMDFIAVEDDFFDGEWHHFALILQRSSSITAYIDGNLQNSMQAIGFGELSGSHMYLGARGYQLPGNSNVEDYYHGALDEFRFWNTARKVEQVRRDKRNRMMADELGLQLYMPFEQYELDPTEVPILMPTLEEQIDTSHIVEFVDTLTLSTQTPTIKLQRPIEAIQFDFSVNNDEIILTPTTSPELIENVTLDITVEGVYDLQGNTMESPKTWIAYVDKNQVVWQDDLLEFEKEAGAELSFSSAILNQGGAAKSYEIKNIPEWLTVTPNTGVIPPNSTKDIDFEVDPLMNIGDYVQDIQLLTDFNFPEKLTIDLKVREKAPDWAVDPADFQNSMGIIGALEINEVISTDREDMLAAFVGDEVRGVNNLQYIEELDRYLVFLDVYSNETFGEEITFKVWDASEGIVYTEVEPEFIIFNANSLEGTTSNPQLFVTSSKIVVDIDVKEGWNWVSNFLLNPDSTNLDITLESIEAETGDEIKGQTVFSNYSNGNGWRGTLNEVGIRPESLYKLNVAKDGVLSWRGDIIDPSARTINLNQNWNWIGFISIRNQSVEQAFGNLNAQDGDLVKGRSQFAVFDSNLGWIGSLETLVPGFGYMYQSAIEQSFTYPVAGMFRNPPESPEELLLDHWPIDYGEYASNMTAIADWNNDCDLFLSEDEFAIGIFDPNGNCRGASMIDVRQENKLHYLTIGGTGLETLHAELLDLSTGQSYPMQEIIEYVSNSHLGSIQEPLQLSFSDEACKNLQLEINPPSDLFNVYPSIFDQHLTIEYVAEIEDEDAVIAIYNIWGQIVFESAIRLKRGFNRIPVVVDNQAITAGTYFSVLRTNGKTEHQKLIKQ